MAFADTPPTVMNFGSPPSGEVPILFNDHHVYVTPDTLRHGRVLGGLVKDGALLVPLRSLFEQMGAAVTYDAANHSAKATNPGSEVEVTPGKPEVIINGESRPLDVPPIVYKGVLLVPVRVISEALGAYVEWVPERRVMVVRYVAPTPVPTLPPTPQPAAVTPPKPTPPPIPAGWDPCGGPLELLNKIGAKVTPCVFVAGEVGLSAGYFTVNIPSNTSLNLTTRFGTFGTSFSTSAHAFGYPASTVYVGVLPRAEIYILPPSFAQVNSRAAATLTGNDVLAAGASDMTFGFKQLLWVNPQKFTMLGLNLAYKAPSGSKAFRGPGPSYTINPILEQPLPHNLGVELAFPVNNFTTVTRTCMFAPPPCTRTSSRGWSFTPILVPYWESQGGTLLAVTVEHSFNPNIWPVGGSLTQLLSRHVAVYVSYGGFDYTAAGAGPFHGLVNATTTTYPTVFSTGVNFLFGRSDLPGALQQ